MCDHTYCYTPAGGALATLVDDGTLGDIQYVDSVRINLGLVQRDIDVLWDLAPHDLSILDYVLPDGLAPVGGRRHGADPIGAGQACVAYLTLQLPATGAIAHVHVNWLSPTKIRTTIIGGSQPHARLGRPEPGPARLASSTAGVDMAPGGRSDLDASDTQLESPTAPATWSRRRSPEREALAADGRRVRRRDPTRARPRAPTARPACASWTSSKRPAQSLASRGGGPLRTLEG